MRRPFRFCRRVTIVACILSLPGACDHPTKSDSRTAPVDVGAGPDLFRDMDCGIELTADEIKGRNAWHVWTAGNDAFWDEMAVRSRGTVDLLRTLDSRKRGSRFKDLGLINEPGYRQATTSDRYKIWLDEPVADSSPALDPKVYGRSSGVLGFRIFPNPAFAGAAVANWDGDRYYNDPAYAAKPELIRPYRVGVSCSACHVAPNPLSPPADPEKPDWKNLASVIGNQYLHEGRVFASGARPGSFFWEMLNAQPRGTSDTSRLATDNINNPNAINPIFLIHERFRIGHEETLSGETLLLAGTQPKMKVPRILKDGADSVGFAGAVLRVFVNTGLFYQHWLQQHQLLYGLTPQKPFSIERAQQESPQWRATEAMVPNLEKFFGRLQPAHLADAPGGTEHITRDQTVLNRGRTVFALNCARCHSSKQPPAGANPDTWFIAQIDNAAFWKDNFLSDEERHPVAVIKTNAARALATNATGGHIWQWFSSDTYKDQTPTDPIQVWNPYTEQDEPFPVSGRGRGSYRTPSLASVWATAPFLHNNSIGRFNGDPSVKGRMEAFQDAIEKLLWPEKRLNRDSIWRTSAVSCLEVPGELVPENLRKLLGTEVDPDGVFRLGPIPKGTPINLLANIDPQADPAALAELARKIRQVLREIRDQKLDDEATRLLMRRELAPMLFQLSKCPDLVEDRGHLFGATLPDEEKLALIEFLKTL